MIANTAPLLHRCKAPYHHMASNLRVTAKRCVVRKNGMVTYHTVMRNMRCDQKQAVIADNGSHRIDGRSGMHRHMLADHTVMPYLER